MNVAYYPEFESCWRPTEADRRRSRRVMSAVLGLFLGFGLVVPLLPIPPPLAHSPATAPERIVRFLLEQPRPKPEPRIQPPPAPPAVLPEAQPRIAEPAPTPVPARQVESRVEATLPSPTPAPARVDARQRAAASGLLALSDQLAALRDQDVESKVQVASLDRGVGEKSRVERALLTARASEGSGGIAVAKASSAFGGGSTGLGDYATTKVAAGRAAGAAAGGSEVERAGTGNRASRTREEVELVFDRNKSAIYAIYSRALRDDPALQGKVVLEVTIAPSGDVTGCRIVSSELGDAELERKLVARVRMFKFEAKDVAPMTTTKPIEFFPA